MYYAFTFPTFTLALSLIFHFCAKVFTLTFFAMKISLFFRISFFLHCFFYSRALILHLPASFDKYLPSLYSANSDQKTNPNN